MQVLLNTCSICKVEFDNWVEYQEHLNLGQHVVIEPPKEVEAQFQETIMGEPKQDGIKVYSSGRTDLKRCDYPGPMDEAQKRLVVAKGETRIGLQHFLSVLVLALPLIAGTRGYSFADSGDCPGNSCHGTQGPIGPQGPAGVNGKDGVNGNTAAQWSGTNLGADIGIRLLDTEYLQVQAFDQYIFGSYPGQDVFGAGYNSIIGMRAVIKLGSSYEERMIDDLKKQVADLKELYLLKQ